MDRSEARLDPSAKRIFQETLSEAEKSSLSQAKRDMHPFKMVEVHRREQTYQYLEETLQPVRPIFSISVVRDALGHLHGTINNEHEDNIRNSPGHSNKPTSGYQQSSGGNVRNAYSHRICYSHLSFSNENIESLGTQAGHNWSFGSLPPESQALQPSG